MIQKDLVIWSVSFSFELQILRKWKSSGCYYTVTSASFGHFPNKLTVAYQFSVLRVSGYFWQHSHKKLAFFCCINKRRIKVWKLKHCMFIWLWKLVCHTEGSMDGTERMSRPTKEGKMGCKHFVIERVAKCNGHWILLPCSAQKFGHGRCVYHVWERREVYINF